MSTLLRSLDPPLCRPGHSDTVQAKSLSLDPLPETLWSVTGPNESDGPIRTDLGVVSEECVTRQETCRTTKEDK